MERQVASKWLNPVPIEERWDELPEASVVAPRAAELYDFLRDRSADHHELYERMVESALMYCDGWGTHAGFVIVSAWNLDTDFEPLLQEAFKALCLKTAVWELTKDEELSELLIPSPVDEMVHAVLAQHNLVAPLEQLMGIEFKHMTDKERFGYEVFGYAYVVYAYAWGGPPPERYWIGTQESARRLTEMNRLYESIGIHDFCRAHEIDFESQPA
jgi:hypothetical protein